MIISFKCKKTEDLFESNYVDKKFINFAKHAIKKLELLNAASSMQDLLIHPGNKLEKLLGRRKEQYSIRINNQWRICFVWHDNNACDVEIVDYH